MVVKILVFEERIDQFSAWDVSYSLA